MFRIVLPLCLLLQACQPAHPSSVNSQSTDVPFADWCRAEGLPDCGGVPDPAADPGRTIRAFDLLAVFMQSESSLRIERRDLDIAEIRHLTDQLSLGEWMRLFDRTGWRSLTMNSSTLVLEKDESAPASAEGNLQMIAATRVSITVDRAGRRLLTDGLSLSTPAGNRYRLMALDFSSPGRLSVATSGGRITDLPLQILTGPAPEILPTPQGTADAGTLISSFLEVLLLPPRTFDWRDRFNLRLSGTELQDMLALILPELASENAAMEGTGVRAGGHAMGDRLLEVSMARAVECGFLVEDVPVIGSARIRVFLDREFGIGELDERLLWGDIQMDFYGIDTNIGRIRYFEFEEDVVKLAIGTLEVPLSLSGEGNGSATDFYCQF